MSWKLLEGQGYSTLEWEGKANDAGEKELERLKEYLVKVPEEKKVTVAVPSGFHYLKEFNKLGLNKVKDRVVYSKDLKNISRGWTDPYLTFLEEQDDESVVRCLSAIVGCRKEAVSMIESLFAEVAQSRFRIYLVKIRGRDAAVFIPHIEPQTEDEGRLFFFGITPEFQGGGHAAAIHRFALTSLKQDLKARIYVGVTDSGNLPMKKVFIRNGCSQMGTIEIYQRQRFRAVF
ncbi:GNAT family protein [Bacillus sp. P14.5]|uniref:GNAT family N-acetyltransferase n=1 Tax=Bacillus sp. P14.5 TaxID=1983400 RepID=UPI000DE8931A|nr:GNAT family protein [Bacillus sp. P14.5]